MKQIAPFVALLGMLLIAGPASPEATLEVGARAVPLNPERPDQKAIGPFVYAGGVELSSDQTSLLHGLSDLEITGLNRLTAIGDLGSLFEARLLFDRDKRLIGVDQARLAPLTDEAGQPLIRKEDADAEGLAILANGDRLVSFERRNRIWLYPAQGGRPRPVPGPEAAFPENNGMEALAADPEAGADAYLVGAEGSGETWRCRQSAGCAAAAAVIKPADFSLVSMKRLPEQRSAYLLRAFDPASGIVRISLRIQQLGKEVARLDLAPPLSVDNFEGVAAVRRPEGGYRFFLLSDDNFSSTQRTLLLAFDWKPR